MGKRKASTEDEGSDHDESDARVTSESEDEPKSKSKGKKKESKKEKTTIKKPKLDTKSSNPKASSSGGKVLTNQEGDKYIDLGKKKRAVVRSFKGMPLLDIREYYGNEGEEKPGKKGISLQLEQWKTLRENASAIDELLSKLDK